MTTIVRFECGCIGTEPDAEGKSAILMPCDGDDGSPGSPARLMNDKIYDPIDYTEEVHRAFTWES